MSTSTTTEGSQQAPASPELRIWQRHKARVLRIWLEITDDQGATKRYAVVPLPNDLYAHRTYRLNHWENGHLAASYECRLKNNGQTSCTCPSGTKRPGFKCKHLACLETAGMLDTALFLDLERRRLEASSPFVDFTKPQRSTSWPSGCTL